VNELSRALTSLAEDTERISLEYGVRRSAIEPEFATRKGDWNGRELTLSTKLWCGPGPLSRLQIATVRGSTEQESMSSLTMIALADPSVGGAVFGADIVGFRGAASTIILDVFAADDPSTHMDAIEQHREQLRSLGVTRSWSQDSPSPFSVNVAWVAPTADVAHVAREVYAGCHGYLRAFLRSLCNTSIATRNDSSARKAQNEWLRRLSSSKRQNTALAKLFGEEWTRAYFDLVFFRAQ